MTKHGLLQKSAKIRFFFLAYDILYGLLCLLDIDDCVNHTCGNGGSCVDGINNYPCNCLLGFTGNYCETGRFLQLEKWTETESRYVKRQNKNEANYMEREHDFLTGHSG